MKNQQSRFAIFIVVILSAFVLSTLSGCSFMYGAKDRAYLRSQAQPQPQLHQPPHYQPTEPSTIVVEPQIHIHENDRELCPGNVYTPEPVPDVPPDAPPLTDAPSWEWFNNSEQHAQPPPVDHRPDHYQAPITAPRVHENDPKIDGGLYSFSAWMRRLYRVPLWMKLVGAVMVGASLSMFVWPYRMQLLKIVGVMRNADLSDGLSQEAKQIKDIVVDVMNARDTASKKATPKK